MKSPYAVLFLTVLLDLIGFGIILPVLPIYARDLGAREFDIGLIAASFSVMTFLWSPILGRWSDRLGRRPILLGCIVINAIGYALFANAQTLAMLIISRVLNGIGASSISVAQAYIADSSSGADRARSLGLIGAAFGLGFIIGPALGGFLKSQFGIAAVGYVPSALSLLNALLAWIRLPEPQRHSFAQRPTFRATVRAACVHPQQSRLILLSFAYWFAFVMMQITFALFANERFGWREDVIGGVFALTGLIGSAIQGGAIGKLVRTFGEKKLLSAGLVLFASGMLALPWMPSSAFLIATLGEIAVGSALVTPTLNALLSLSTDASLQGAILGLSQSVASLARIVGPIVGMGLYALGHEVPYVAAGIIGFACFFALALPLHSIEQHV